MDPISHGALAASCAESAAGGGRILAAGIVGSLAGIAPDLDVVIRSASDPLMFLEYHRHFTHALAFAPVGALACATLLHAFVRGRLAFGQTYLFSLLGYSSHGLLDACTSYGTLLLWPFSDLRIAFSIISVVDPLFTLPVIAFAALALQRRKAVVAYFGVLWALAYLGVGVVQHDRAAALGARIASVRGHVPVRLEVKPALGSLLLWKTIYEYDGRYYVDAVRMGLEPTFYAGESIEKLDLARDFAWLSPSCQQAVDVERFRRISGDLLAVSDTHPDRIIDLRYSMVPNEIAGFWAIVLDPQADRDAHVGFVTTTHGTLPQAQRLLAMLF